MADIQTDPETGMIHALSRLQERRDLTIENIFHTQGFDLNLYMPDALLKSVNVGANIAVVNAIIVSLVCIVLFMALTVKVFKSRDIK